MSLNIKEILSTWLDKIRKSLIGIILAIVLVASFAWIGFLQTPIVPKDATKPLSLVFLPGSNVRTLANTLKSQGLLDKPRFFIWLARLKGVSHNLHAGEYVFAPGTTPSELLNKIAKGEAVMHLATIIEGWNFKQVLAAINANPYLVHTIVGLNDAEVMKKIGAPGVMPEGNFAPDTYFFSGKMNDVAILQIAYKLMQKRLGIAWQERSPLAIYKCPYEALIVASLIEKETAFKAERPEVAGVILRRLQKWMPLQIDATVIYGLGDDYTGKLHGQDLLRDTRYNTYLHLGFPPTPIAMPSNDALYAALHPALGTALYYVSKGNGTHEFSDTLAEHDAAIKKYLLKR